MTRQVALADDTYERLKANKKPGESFSQTIERLLDTQPKDPLSFPDRVPKSPLEAEERLRRIEEDREDTRVDA